jgi:hypothetical protein
VDDRSARGGLPLKHGRCGIVHLQKGATAGGSREGHLHCFGSCCSRSLLLDGAEHWNRVELSSLLWTDREEELHAVPAVLIRVRVR